VKGLDARAPEGRCIKVLLLFSQTLGKMTVRGEPLVLRVTCNLVLTEHINVKPGPKLVPLLQASEVAEAIETLKRARRGSIVYSMIARVKATEDSAVILLFVESGGFSALSSVLKVWDDDYGMCRSVRAIAF
jgi:hypothetical protein